MKAVYSGLASSISVPGSQSPFQALVNHAPIVSALDEGIIKIVEQDGTEQYFVSTTGFVEINKNQVSVLVEKADNAASLDLSTLEAALKKAEEKINMNTLDINAAEAAKAEIKSIALRIKAVSKLSVK